MSGWKLIRIAILVITILMIAACGKNSLAGKYRLDQSGVGFGKGAEKTTLELRDDQTFELKIADLELAKGTWKAEGNHVFLSNSTEDIGTEFHVLGGKLIPSIQGKDVTIWRFIRQ